MPSRVFPSTPSSLIEADTVIVELEKAVPLSLILNELVSNALLHAFTGRHEGTLQIHLRRTGENEATLIISDNGKGFPDNTSLTEPSTLGLTLILGLVQQIDGTIELNRDGGTTFIIKFHQRDHRDGSFNADHV